MNIVDIKPISFGRYGLLALIAIVVSVAWLPITDHIADADIDAGFNRALVSFGIAKGLNMVISLLQSTQFSAQPLGVGIAISPGELLDPINDLVEQFSNVMLLATVAFGIQKILIGIGGHVLVKTVLSVFGIMAAWFVFKDRPVPYWLKNALILIVLVRLAVPAATVMANGAYQLFLEPQYQASTTALNDSSLQLEALKSATQQPVAPAPQPEAVAPANDNWWSRAKATVTNAVPSSPSDFMQRVNTQINGMNQRIQQIGEQVTRNVVSQIVVFLLQTLIFPIGLIWILYKIGISLMYRSRS